MNKIKIIERSNGKVTELEGPIKIIFENSVWLDTAPRGLYMIVQYYLDNHPDVITGTKVFDPSKNEIKE